MSVVPENQIVSSIRLRTGNGGQCRVFIVQTRNRAEVNHVHRLFADLERCCSVRALASGVTTSYAIQATGQYDAVHTLDDVLKEHFKFSVVYDGFNPVIYRIVEDLAMDTGSQLHPVPSCVKCNRLEPFPVRVTLVGPAGKAKGGAMLCEGCLAEVNEEREAEGICGLLRPVTGELRATPATSIIRKRSLARYIPGPRGSRVSRSTEAPDPGGSTDSDQERIAS